MKFTPSEFQVWAAKARGWVLKSNFLAAEINVHHLYMNAILDKETQQKAEALPEYATSDVFEVLQLVEGVHDTANPLFVKRSNFYAAHREVGETGSSYIARVKVLGDLAKLSSMDEHEHVKFKVLRDLPAKVREKVLSKSYMSLEAMTKLVEAYQIGCWICGGQHRRDKCEADKSGMICELCGIKKNHVTAVCLRQWTDSSPAGQPGGRPGT